MRNKKKIIKLKKEIVILKKELHIELKKPIKHTCRSCGKQFDAYYYQTISCKYCNTINRTRGVEYSSVSKELHQKNCLLSKLEKNKGDFIIRLM